MPEISQIAAAINIFLPCLKVFAIMKELLMMIYTKCGSKNN